MEAGEISQLKAQAEEAYQQLGYDALTAKLEALEAEMAEPDFWKEPKTANEKAKKAGEYQKRLEPWQKLLSDIEELAELHKLGDIQLEKDLNKQYEKLKSEFNGLKEQLKLSGPFDNHSAILSIFAGAGGTDAQDWAEMLLRMYSRYFESAKWPVSTINISKGDEAGIKSVTLDISEAYAYGNLRSEHGVHRLVRLSPFNADSLRQTSFARVELVPKIEEPDEAPIEDKDLKIDVFRAGGHGGQSVNTTDSAVRITHLPTGITVSIQNERSQLQNKETAMTILRSKLIQLQLEQHKDKLSEIKGPNEQAAWGNQIRNYVLHPYKQVKDLRSGYESSEPEKVLDGNLQPLIDAYLEQPITD